MLSDSLLIERIRQGDTYVKKASFDSLVNRYKAPLYRFICRTINDVDIAEDILQAVFMRVYFKLDSYDDTRPFKIWVYQIAANTCRDHYRRTKVRNFLTFHSDTADTALELTGDHYTPEQGVDAQQQLLLVQQAIQKLPYKLKTALLLFTVEEHSLKECADILGVSPKAVEARVYRARQQLTKLLSGVMPADAY